MPENIPFALWIDFSRWSHKATRFLYDRIYVGGWRWTPFVVVRTRHRRLTVGWKGAAMKAVILNQNFGVRIEHVSSQMPDERVQQPRYLGIGKSLSEPAKQKEYMTTISELREKVKLTNEEQAALWSDTLGSRSYGQLIAEAASEKAVRETLRWVLDWLKSRKGIIVDGEGADLLQMELRGGGGGLEPPEETRP